MKINIKNKFLDIDLGSIALSATDESGNPVDVEWAIADSAKQPIFSYDEDKPNVLIFKNVGNIIITAKLLVNLMDGMM